MEFVDEAIVADFVYDSVIGKLNIDGDDVVYRELMLGILKRQTKDQLIFAIWNSLSEQQAAHLRDYIDQMAVIAPWLPIDNVLMEFAMLYPNLMEKIHTNLSDFFQDFVKKFNEIKG